MKIREIELYDCKIDSEFNEVKEGVYSLINKAIVGNEQLESVVYLEFNKDQYDYVNKLNYRELLFNLKGIFQIRKNKKDIPFMILKVNSITNTEEIKVSNLKNKKKLKKKTVTENNNTEINKDLGIPKEPIKRIENRFQWKKLIPNLDKHLTPMNVDKIKLVDGCHRDTEMLTIKFVKENPIMAVRQIDDTDEYELILGYKSYVSCKILNILAKVYVIQESREAFIERLNQMHNEFLKSKLEHKELN